ncbi:hypothetical protein LXL04_020993 [Taraxacum kok-saghyz]
MVDLAIPADHHHSSTHTPKCARTMCRNGRLENHATIMDSLGYPRDASAIVLFGEWFRFGKPSDQYPHNIALTTYFRLIVSSPKTRIRVRWKLNLCEMFLASRYGGIVLFGEWFRFGKPSDQYPHNIALTTYFRLIVSSPKTRIRIPDKMQ